MDQAAFEQSVLQMAHRGGVQRLTPAAVGYQLKLSVRDAERMLDKMVTEAKLELDSDDDGNLYYFVPGQGDPGVFTSGIVSAPPPDNTPQPPQQANPYGIPPLQGPATTSPQNASPYGAQSGGYGAQNNPYGAQQGNAQSYGQPPVGVPPGQYAAPPSSNPAFGQPYGGSQPYGAPPQAPPYGAPPGPPPQQYGTPFTAPAGAPPGYVPAAAVGQGRPQHGHAGQWHQHQQTALTHVPQHGAGSPSTAALLGFIPGAGQLYNGEVTKGLAVFFATAVFMGSVPFLAPAVWMWGMVDAHRTARKQQQQAQQPHYGLLGP